MAWQAVYGDGQAVWSTGMTFKSNYWIFDGATGQGDSASSYGFSIARPPSCSNSSSHIVLAESGGDAFNNSILSHVEIQGCGSAYNTSQNGIYSLSGANILVSRNYIHDIGHMMLIRSWSDSVVEHNYFKNNWSTPEHHGEAISNDFDTHVIYRYNVFENACEGTGCIAAGHGGSGNLNADDEVYGNLFFGGDGGGNGPVNCGSVHICAGFKIYNNTFANFAGPLNFVSGTGDAWFFRNNIFFGTGVVALPGQHDYNWCLSALGSSCSAVSSESNGVIGSADPFVDATLRDYHLTAGSSAIDQGSPLVGEFSVDRDGTPIPQGAGWDMGAYEFIP